ncbi:type I-G CRISPR-associated protein, Cas3-extension family [Streptomyces klenkii]|uniref:type I-G CRISPR-associated protein, Cas3-extension family n=1 Tax=Streptomyces klenkii TaxID=1420899 RepID=UPI00343E636C
MTDHELELPALLGNSPLGFLAALGLLQLTQPLLEQPPRLSWRGPDAPAVLHTHQPLTHQSLADLLARQLPLEDDDLLTVAPGILGLPASGPFGDALRMPVDLALDLLACHAQAERDRSAPTARWFTALVNQLSLETSNKKTAGRPASGDRGDLYTTTTPHFGRTGQMTLAASWAKAADHCRSDSSHLIAALVAWRRVDDYAGANLDHYATGDAHMVSHGKASQRGVPGATWLALHGLAAFRLTGDTTRAQTTSWDHTAPNGALTWPIWKQPLTTTAITALLEHPLVRHPNPDTTKLHNLGVTALYVAHRTRLGQGHGPLQPARRIHPAPTSNDL